MKTKPPAHPSGIAAWLTASELLAIVLRSGLEGKNAVELAREILLHFGSVPAMMTAWRDIKGLSAAKLAQVLAALELGRRAALPDKREETFVKSTAQAAAYCSVRLRGLAEVLRDLSLATQTPVLARLAAAVD